MDKRTITRGGNENVKTKDDNRGAAIKCFHCGRISSKMKTVCDHCGMGFSQGNHETIFVDSNGAEIQTKDKAGGIIDLGSEVKDITQIL